MEISAKPFEKFTEFFFVLAGIAESHFISGHSFNLIYAEAQLQIRTIYKYIWLATITNDVLLRGPSGPTRSHQVDSSVHRSYLSSDCGYVIRSQIARTYSMCALSLMLCFGIVLRRFAHAHPFTHLHCKPEVFVTKSIGDVSRSARHSKHVTFK